MNKLSQKEEAQDILGDYTPIKLPGTLNVLTILTFIGCAYSLYTVGYYFFDIIHTYQGYDIAEKTPYAISEAMKNYFEQLEFRYNTRYLLLIIGLLSVLCCFVGALKMRKLKKSGLIIYLTGELLFPLLIIILYSFQWNGLLDFLPYLAPVLFSALYISQRSHLS